MPGGQNDRPRSYRHGFFFLNSASSCSRASRPVTAEPALDRRRRPGKTGGGREVFAEIRSFLVHHPLRHRLAALIVVGRVVKRAIAAYVQRPVALRTVRVNPTRSMVSTRCPHFQQFIAEVHGNSKP